MSLLNQGHLPQECARLPSDTAAGASDNVQTSWEKHSVIKIWFLFIEEMRPSELSGHRAVMEPMTPAQKTTQYIDWGVSSRFGL